jgi:hypothetical protein
MVPVARAAYPAEAMNFAIREETHTMASAALRKVR